MALTQAAQVLSISTALLGAGGIACLSLFDVPELQAQTASTSLPQLRWLFSRGSHIFPAAAEISAAGFLYLAYSALPANLRSASQLLKTTNGLKANTYAAAAVLSIAIYPVTRFIMVPNNFALMKKNEEKGGARSESAAKKLQQSDFKPGERSAEDSVYSKGEGSQFTDLSGPQRKVKSSSEAEDEEVREMLARFGRQNWIRAILLGAGGVVGLVAALS